MSRTKGHNGLHWFERGWIMDLAATTARNGRQIAETVRRDSATVQSVVKQETGRTLSGYRRWKTR